MIKFSDILYTIPLHEDQVYRIKGEWDGGEHIEISETGSSWRSGDHIRSGLSVAEVLYLSEICKDDIIKTIEHYMADRHLSMIHIY